MTERDALLVLNAIPGLGNRRIEKFERVFSDLSAVFKLKKAVLKERTRLPESIIENIINFPRDPFLKREYNFIACHGLRIITKSDDSYPEALRSIPDAPVVLYIKGTLPKIRQNAIAIVGSRRASLYGETHAEKMAMRLSESGIIIVSGMARGIDTSAHRGALKAKGITIAVLGAGFSSIYPPENKKLAEDIAANGALISEFPFLTLPKPYNFPRRNRIVSGLSIGVVVVEAAQKSGALITADFALEQGREVYAVPGLIDAPQAMGVHNLIKQGAKLITGVEDILEDIKLMGGAAEGSECLERFETDLIAQAGTGSMAEHLTSAEKHVCAFLKTRRPLFIEDISSVCEYPISEVGAILLHLEMKGYVQQLPGKFFIRCKTQEVIQN